MGSARARGITNEDRRLAGKALWGLVDSTATEVEGRRSTPFTETLLHSGVMRGAPEYAVHMHSPELSRAQGSKAEGTGGNWARGVRRLHCEHDELNALFDAALDDYATLQRAAVSGKLDPARSRTIEAAVQSGDLEMLRRTLQSK